MSKVKVPSVSQLVTWSPIELFWTAKNIAALKLGENKCNMTLIESNIYLLNSSYTVIMKYNRCGGGEGGGYIFEHVDQGQQLMGGQRVIQSISCLFLLIRAQSATYEILFWLQRSCSIRLKLPTLVSLPSHFN